MDKKKEATDFSINVYKPDIEAFTRLWSSLRTFYDGTDVTRRIAKLLHVYQPENGVVIYANLLRTLYDMLKNFDPKGFCTLASMVPPPKNCSEATVEKVFYDNTGHYRLNVPVLRFNKNACRHNNTVPESQVNVKKPATQVCSTVSTSISEAKINSAKNSTWKRSANETNLPLKKRKAILNTENQKTPTNTKSEFSKVLSTSEPSKAVKKPLQICHENVQNPISVNSASESKWNQVLHQKKLHQTNVEVKSKHLLTQSELARNFNKIVTKPTNSQSDSAETVSEIINVDVSKKIDKENVQFFHKSLCKPMNEEEKMMQHAIRKDIHKMDYVQIGCENTFAKFTYEVTQDNPFEIKDNLKQSLKNFLSRIKSGATCPVPEFSKTQSIAQTQCSNLSPINMTKKDIMRTTSGQKMVNESSGIIYTSQSYQKNSSEECFNKSMKRKRPDPPTRPRSERVAQRNLQNASLDFKTRLALTPAKRRTVKEKMDNTLEIRYSNADTATACQTKYPAMEMTGYKNQYCDAFMSIQRAKIAVANSLAISSVTNNPGCYPYYVNYYNRPHHMMRQQFMIDPYYQNNWQFQSYGQYRTPQPAHTVYCAMNPTKNKYPMFSGAYCQAINNSTKIADAQQSKVNSTETCSKHCSDKTESNV